MEIYLEPFLPKPQLVIVGSSPLAEILAQFGTLLDFKVVAANADFDSVKDQINESSYVVVATMGNRDEEGLLAVLGTRPKYLGLVASRKKAEALFEYVRETGSSEADIAVITCPAGIAIGSETLPEIALSVAAEIVRLRRATVEPQAAAEKVPIDPICGMTVDVATAKYTSVVDGKTTYFCCLRCKETFDRPQISQIEVCEICGSVKRFSAPAYRRRRT